MDPEMHPEWQFDRADRTIRAKPSRRPSLRIAGRAALAGTVTLVASLALLDQVFPPDLSRLDSLSQQVLDHRGEPLRAFPAADGRWRYAVDQPVSDRFIDMLVGYEDHRFWSHPGVDPLALARAVGLYAWHGRVVSGGSTLTMQTARLLEPRPRTPAAKLIEIFRAFQLERRYSKADILRFYLTLAPYGGNLEGVVAASRFYFGKEPSILSTAEAALLIALPQAPTARRPDRHHDAARAARDSVLRRLVALGRLEPEAIGAVDSTPLPQGRMPTPFLSAHLTGRLHRRFPTTSIIRTTLDAELQIKAEALVRSQSATLPKGVSIAALIVENTPTDGPPRAVRVSIGSPDLFDTDASGAIDMTRAIRSPGSTLKPFIYGLAFEQRLVHPRTMIADRARSFGAYRPANFDNRFRGDVTIAQALHLSLNIPAVAILDRLGPARLAGDLARAGFPLTLQREVPPGLPIALGGAGTSLADLTALYAGLADGGRILPLAEMADAVPSEARSLVSTATAAAIGEILKDAPAPNARMVASHTASGRVLAFKTGTSYGFRDAWAIGYDHRYTIGVWIGQVDGSFGSRRTGRDSAAPLLFALADLLPAQRPEQRPGLAAAGPDDTFFRDPPPPALARFDRPGPDATGSALGPSDLSGNSGLRLTFPRDGSVIEISGTGSTLRGLALSAEGGTLPLAWLVDGVRLEAQPFKRTTSFRPTGRGAHRITVIDAQGRAAQGTVWLE